MRSLIFLCFLGFAAVAYAIDAEGLPAEFTDLAEPGSPDPASKGPWSWEIIDGKKFKVYKHEDRIPHGFSKKVFVKKTRDHIIKYIRLKKCGCRIQTSRKTWEGPHKKLWYDDKHTNVHNHGPTCGCKTCGNHGHGHYHGHHGNHGPFNGHK